MTVHYHHMTPPGRPTKAHPASHTLLRSSESLFLTQWETIEGWATESASRDEEERITDETSMYVHKPSQDWKPWPRNNPHSEQTMIMISLTCGRATMYNMQVDLLVVVDKPAACLDTLLAVFQATENPKPSKTSISPLIQVLIIMIMFNHMSSTEARSDLAE